MQKSKKAKFIIFVFIIIILITIALIYILNEKEKDLTLSMYKNISNSQKYTITMEGQDSEYSYKISIAQKGTDISIDMNSKFEDEEQHTSTLVTDRNAYYIMHNEQEYITLDSEDIEADSLIPEMKDIDGKIYQKGKEEIKGKSYYYEEYEDIATFLMLVDVNEEGNIKTRFYYDDGEIAYIKNIIEQDQETIEELVKVKCNFDAEDSLFEIPEDYAEIE